MLMCYSASEDKHSMGETRIKRSKKSTKGLEHGSKADSMGIERLSLKSINDKTHRVKHTELNQEKQDISRQVLKADDLEADPPYIEIRETEHKGLAVFATRKIPAGALIFAETPLIRLTQLQEDAAKSDPSVDGVEEEEEEGGEKGEEEVNSALTVQFNSLSKSTQKSYLALFDSEKSGFSKVKSIYYSNCYNLSGANKPSKSSPGGSCIGLAASRINHSCLPNVQFSYDETHNLMLFHAVKAIPRGREAVSNYDSVYELRAQRQKRQVLYYGFRCACEACDPGASEFWARSDERRRGLIEARKEVRECESRFEDNNNNNGGSTSSLGLGLGLGLGLDPVASLERVEMLLIKEGLVALPLADTYKSLVKWAERSGDGNGMVRWRRKELEVCVTCMGKSSARAQELMSRLGMDR